MSTRRLGRLLRHAVAAGAKLVLAGDNKQLRIVSNRSGLKFDVSGDNGDDRIELSGVWRKARVIGGKGTDTLKNRGIGLLELNGVEFAE